MADSLGHSCIPTCRIPYLCLQPQPGLDPFVGQVAANMLQQSGSTYLQRGQDFVRSRMGFLSGSSMHYLFNVNGDYGELSSLSCENCSMAAARPSAAASCVQLDYCSAVCSICPQASCCRECLSEASAFLPRAGSQHQHAMFTVHCTHAARSVSHSCCKRLSASQQH